MNPRKSHTTHTHTQNKSTTSRENHKIPHTKNKVGVPGTRKKKKCVGQQHLHGAQYAAQTVHDVGRGVDVLPDLLPKILR